MEHQLKKQIVAFCNKYSIENEDLNLLSSIRIDMGLDGDDAFYFLKDFQKNFNVDFKGLDVLAFFHSEYELKNRFWPIRKHILRHIHKELLIHDLFLLMKNGSNI